MLLKINKYVLSSESDKNGRTFVQWAIAFLEAMVFVTVGTLIGWVSPAKKILISDASPTGAPLTDGEMSAVASTMTLTAILGVPTCTYVAEAFGRKTSILMIILLQALCWIIKLVGPNAAGLIVARASAGIAYGGCYLVIPTYVREISQENIKGVLVTVILSSQYIGVLAIYAMGSYLNYYTPLWIMLCFTLVSLILTLLIPETPVFLVKKGKIEVATKTLATLRRLPEDNDGIKNEIKCMKDEDERYKTAERISVTSILKNKAWLRGILLSQVLAACVSLNGTFGIMTYALSIMTQAGVSVDPKLQSLIVPILLMFGTIVPMAFVEKAGRRPPLGGALVTSAVSMGGLASALLAQRYGAVVPGWLIILCIAVAVASYSAGVVSMPTIIMIDMFKFQIRAKIMTFTFMFTLVLLSVYVAIFDPMLNAFGLYTVFYMSAAVNLFGAVVVLLWLPETKGRSTDQIEALLVGKTISHPGSEPYSGAVKAAHKQTRPAAVATEAAD